MTTHMPIQKQTQKQTQTQNVLVLMGLQHGDEGKGKISKHLSDTGEYDCFVRYNGGPNAGHTIYIKGKQLVLHQIPCGIVNNKPCLISSNCVVDMAKLLKETRLLIEHGIQVYDLLHIAYNVHMITNEAIEEDKKTNVLGTTNSGIGPTYSRKA
jgi:adenylosuccinate synthase